MIHAGDLRADPTRRRRSDLHIALQARGEAGREAFTQVLVQADRVGELGCAVRIDDHDAAMGADHAGGGIVVDEVGADYAALVPRFHASGGGDRMVGFIGGQGVGLEIEAAA